MDSAIVKSIFSAYISIDASFDEILKSRGLRLHEVPADGNCHFESIAYHLRHCGIKISAADVRQQVVEYIRKNPTLVTIYYKMMFIC